MAKTKDVMLSVSQVVALEPGDEDNATWINPGFCGVVESIEKKPKRAGGFLWQCTIQDLNDDAQIYVSFFQAPKFSEGDTIEIFGQGLRRTEYNGKPQAAVGKSTEVAVVAAARPGSNQPASRPAQSQPPADTGYQPQEPAGANPTGFHGKMKAHALLYLHCLAYARKINTTQVAQGHAAMEPAQFQACVSTLFIAGDRCGLAVNPPAMASKETTATTPEPAPQGGRAEPPKPGTKPKAGPGGSVAQNIEDEDVPF